MDKKDNNRNTDYIYTCSLRPWTEEWRQKKYTCA